MKKQPFYFIEIIRGNVYIELFLLYKWQGPSEPNKDQLGRCSVTRRMFLLASGTPHSLTADNQPGYPCI